MNNNYDVEFRKNYKKCYKSMKRIKEKKETYFMICNVRTFNEET